MAATPGSAPPDGARFESERTWCTACRGTGRVISGLGGTPHEVACPWCRGTGRFAPGSDAQAAPAERAEQ